MSKNLKSYTRGWPSLAAVVATSILVTHCSDLSGRDKLEAPTFSNLIVVMIDTLRSDYLSSYGGHESSGDFLAQLATEGIQLQGYSASSWTRPSVATLLTGLYPQRHQVLSRDDALAIRTPYLPEMLRDNGVQTAALVTNGNVSKLFGFARGFDLFRTEMGAGKPKAKTAVDRALELAEQFSPPFFFYIHLMDPHTPYLPDNLPGKPDVSYPAYIQPQQVLRGEVEFNEENVTRLKSQYLGEIQEMDPHLERLMSQLDHMGLLEDTLVIVTSDHGEEFNDHGGLGHGFTLYEEMLRVPMILWAKNGISSRRSEATFHQVDFAPTVLAALGQPLPDSMDGQSRWVSILAESPQPSGDYLFHLDLDEAKAEAMNQETMKLIRQIESSEVELFDLGSDPLEKVDLASDRSTVERLEHQLRDLTRKLEETQYESDHAEPTHSVREQLEALGYLGDD